MLLENGAKINAQVRGRASLNIRYCRRADSLSRASVKDTCGRTALHIAMFEESSAVCAVVSHLSHNCPGLPGLAH
jgi:hypothetical protein